MMVYGVDIRLESSATLTNESSSSRELIEGAVDADAGWDDYAAIPEAFSDTDEPETGPLERDAKAVEDNHGPSANQVERTSVDHKEPESKEVCPGSTEKIGATEESTGFEDARGMQKAEAAPLEHALNQAPPIETAPEKTAVTAEQQAESDAVSAMLLLARRPGRPVFIGAHIGDDSDDEHELFIDDDGDISDGNIDD
jgi:hypothetical protein